MRTVDPPAVAAPTTRRRRDERAVAVFGSWMLFGLFLDGWAHQAQKPETFFSPWHGVLYSGFVAAVLWFAWDGWRSPSGDVAIDRWMPIGLGLFIAGAVGDGVWHEIFGIEVDLEALLSPTHLLLLIGGFLLVTHPLRGARDDVREVAPTWSDWWPQAVTLTLSTALVGFFTMYLSAYQGVARESPGQPLSDLFQAHGIARILATNLLHVATLLFVLRRWQPPRGTFLLLFVVVGLAMSGLRGFDEVELVLSAVVAGVVAEVVRAGRTGRSPAAVVGAVSLAWWASFFAIADVSYGVRWPVELWSGTIVLATASSLLFERVTAPRAV